MVSVLVVDALVIPYPLPSFTHLSPVFHLYLTNSELEQATGDAACERRIAIAIDAIKASADAVKTEAVGDSSWNKGHWRFVKRLSPKAAVKVLMKSFHDEVKPLLARSSSSRFDLAEIRQRVPQVPVSEINAKDHGEGKAVYAGIGKKLLRRHNPAKRRKVSKRRRPSTTTQLTWSLYTGCTAKFMKRLNAHRRNLRNRRHPGEAKAKGGLFTTNTLGSFVTNTLGPDREVSHP
jgi:predicted GIY-YIG superfamily endonuclease